MENNKGKGVALRAFNAEDAAQYYLSLLEIPVQFMDVPTKATSGPEMMFLVAHNDEDFIKSKVEYYKPIVSLTTEYVNQLEVYKKHFAKPVN